MVYTSDLKSDASYWIESSNLSIGTKIYPGEAFMVDASLQINFKAFTSNVAIGLKRNCSFELRPKIKLDDKWVRIPPPGS